MEPACYQGNFNGQAKLQRRNKRNAGLGTFMHVIRNWCTKILDEESEDTDFYPTDFLSYLTRQLCQNENSTLLVKQHIVTDLREGRCCTTQ